MDTQEFWSDVTVMSYIRLGISLLYEYFDTRINWTKTENWV